MWETARSGAKLQPPSEAGRGVPFLSTRNLSQSGFLLNDMKYVSKDDHAEFSKRVRAESGDVLYTKGGTTGIAIVNTLDFEFSVWVHVAVLKVASDHVSPYYVALALNAPHGYDQSQAFTHGTGNRDLGLTRMVKITVPLPPLAEQHRIVARVSELMGLLDRLEGRLTSARTAHVAFAAAAVHHLDA
jgi:type I restriction enzyme S subunit